MAEASVVKSRALPARRFPRRVALMAETPGEESLALMAEPPGGKSLALPRAAPTAEASGVKSRALPARRLPRRVAMMAEAPGPGTSSTA
ncbi:MAG: hypothetical protein AB1938_19715 [Myxococcota bacterium]